MLLQKVHKSHFPLFNKRICELFGINMKAHHKKYYSSLFAIILLIVATAFVLQRYGSNDLVGVANVIIGMHSTEAQTTATSSSAEQTATSLSAEDLIKAGGDLAVTYDADELLYTKDYIGFYASDNTWRVYYDKNTKLFLSHNYAISDPDPNSHNPNLYHDTTYIGVLNFIKNKYKDSYSTTNVEIILYDANTNIVNSEKYYTINNIEEIYNDFPATKEKKEKSYKTTATSLGLSGESADINAIAAEDRAVNRYVKTTLGYSAIDYNIETDHYVGVLKEDTELYYDGENIGTKIAVKESDGTEKEIYVFKEKKAARNAQYYSCSDYNSATEECNSEKQSYTGDLAVLKAEFKKVENEKETLETKVARGMKNGEVKDPENTADTGVIKSTIRQQAYMNRLYQQQESHVVGLLSGYLNNWIDKKLGSFSRGVPAGICKYIFGLEYYKQDGWTAVLANTSSSQLQQQLIAQSRTVIIEGEKEEITENLFRYAYTIKLLANQSLEWQTYLYNSCNGKTSVEQFYDYGALAPAAYFAFHYAGSGEQDMIFDCTQEDCLYDQACVAFTDGTEPVCVSLVHGAGFETPYAGSDYDCV